MFITVRDNEETYVINMNEIVYVERCKNWVNFVPSSERSVIKLNFDSTEEAEIAMKEISLLIEEKQQK